MDPLKIKRNIRIAAIVLIITIGNAMRIANNGEVRTVEAISFLALGIAIGVLAVNFSLYRKIKN